jgi:hypothetical protein
MKTNTTLILGVLSLVMFVAGCDVEAVEPLPDEAPTNEQTVVRTSALAPGSCGPSTIFQLTPNSPFAPYCTSSVAECAVSPQGVVAMLNLPCQCMTTPPQPVYTFKPALVAGFLKCKP